jgi:epoxyqueuosine reductase
MNPTQRSIIIKQIAKDLGFLNCGISEARFLEEEATRLEDWLKTGKHGSMAYMERNFDKRLDPRKLVEGTQSVISFSFNYYTEEKTSTEGFKISKYAFGDDYHEVIKERLDVFFQRLKEHCPELEGRAFVDSAPVMDKIWAKESGLGWIGKHSNLISKKQGSFFFLAELLINLPCEYDHNFQTDHCGSCTACIDACPTEAIVEPYLVDGSKCISYFTIELKEQIPSNMQGKFDDWIFGCDVCQDVCPWNRFSIAHKEEKFQAKQEILQYSKSDWDDLKEEEFKILFKRSPLKRSKYDGLRRNIEFVQQKKDS